jgi:hypothetical protein
LFSFRKIISFPSFTAPNHERQESKIQQHKLLGARATEESKLPPLPPRPPEYRPPDGGACGNDARAKPGAGRRTVIFNFVAHAHQGRASGYGETALWSQTPR